MPVVFIVKLAPFVELIALVIALPELIAVVTKLRMNVLIVPYPAPVSSLISLLVTAATGGTILILQLAIVPVPAKDTGSTTNDVPLYDLTIAIIRLLVSAVAVDMILTYIPFTNDNPDWVINVLPNVPSTAIDEVLVPVNEPLLNPTTDSSSSATNKGSLLVKKSFTYVLKFGSVLAGNAGIDVNAI
jgi:hypothetical protein